MKRRIAMITGGVIALGLWLAWRGLPIFEVFGVLSWGWLTYSRRVLPQVTPAWDGIVTGLLCMVLFTVGLHRTLRWLAREVQNARGTAVPGGRLWSFRWTASLVTLIVLMFMVGLAATGIVHQAGWLIASRRSVLEPKPLFRGVWGTSADHLRDLALGSGILTWDRNPQKTGGSHPKAGPVQSWMTDLLPGIMFGIDGTLHNELSWNDPRNSAYFKGVVPVYLNPEIEVFRNNDGYALSHYAGNMHVLSGDRAWLRDTQGGISHTILAGEVADQFKAWGDPTNLRDPGLGINQSPDGFGGPSGSGGNLVFLDGSVRFFRNSTPRSILKRWSMPTEASRVEPQSNRE